MEEEGEASAGVLPDPEPPTSLFWNEGGAHPGRLIQSRETGYWAFLRGCNGRGTQPSLSVITPCQEPAQTNGSQHHPGQKDASRATTHHPPHPAQNPQLLTALPKRGFSSCCRISLHPCSPPSCPAHSGSSLYPILCPHRSFPYFLPSPSPPLPYAY